MSQVERALLPDALITLQARVLELERRINHLEVEIQNQNLMLQCSSEAIILLDPALRIVCWNRAAETMYGWNAQDVLDQPLSAMFGPCFSTTTSTEALLSALFERNEWHGTIAYPHRQGRELLIDISLRRIHDETGVTTAVIAVSRDISTYGHASAAQRFLTEAGAVLNSSPDCDTALVSIAHLAVQHISDWCVIHVRAADESLRVLALEHADVAMVERALRLDPHYGVGNEVAEYIVQVLLTGQPLLLSDMLEPRVTGFAEDRAHAPSGNELGLRSLMCVPLTTRGRTFGTLSLIMAESGRHYHKADLVLAQEVALQAARAIDNARLIGEREQALRSAQAQAQALDLVFQHVPAGLAVHDIAPDFQIVRHNAHLLQLVDEPLRARSSLQGVSLAEMFAHASYVSIRAVFEQVVRTAERFTNDECALVWPSEQSPRYYTISITPLKNDRDVVTALLSSAVEITARKQAEEERLRLERQLFQAQKLESLGILAGGVAHDFNNLLVAILGNTGLVLLDLERDSPLRDHLQQIEIAARRAADLTRQMLAYAGKGRFVVEPINLNAVVNEIADLLYAAIPQNVVLHKELAASLPTIEADSTQIRQIVMNLVVNAAEAIGTQAGKITITTGTLMVEPNGHVEPEFDQKLVPGTYVYFEVQDTGCGMDAATRARIFEPFYTTKFTGRGLGLAAVLGIVRSHKGMLLVSSEPGRGSTFRVMLPSSEQAALVLPIKQSSQWQTSGTVLVIDDQNDVRAVVVQMLQRAGFSVLAASDGYCAIDLLQAHSTAIVAILLDMTMPWLSCEDTISAIRKIQADVPIVLMTGYSVQEATGRFANTGLAGLLHKPFTTEELHKMLQQVLARRSAPLEHTAAEA